MFYAKSDPEESIKEHTDKLLQNLEILKRLYGEKIIKLVDIDEKRFWELMKIICIYHDTGKVFTAFQNVIRKKLKKELLSTEFKYDLIKHEQISPAFIPSEKYNLSKEERKLVYQSIFYHHEREQWEIDKQYLYEIIEKDIKPNLDKIKQELQIEIGDLRTFYIPMVQKPKRIHEGDKLYKEYCIMKGLLHRLDHCSSAHINIEDETESKIYEFVESFIESKNSKPNELQRFSKENSNNNLIVIGSTGVGKTEASLLWSNSDKTFFTLPLRISINAIYDRILEQLKYEHVGILHSTTLDYLEDKKGIENEIEKIEQSRNLYEKITTSTIDQIFPFVFKYKGYEKMYATLSYSKVIIDEIQAYSPSIVAIILKGLQMINNIGGKFMVMTATLPRIYKERLEEMGIEFEYNEFLSPIKRHKIKLQDLDISEDIQVISEKAKDNKVLIIVNTVNKAMELYSNLRDTGVENVNLLHSRFILRDRNEKEREIKEFSKSEEKKGLWITTQIIEASLDIDFDYLYTEMSTLDSLFQRLGRCYRSREYKKDECNITIYTKSPSGIEYIYDNDISQKSIEILKKYDNQILEESVKVRLVDELYSKENIKNTDFYKEFKEALEILNNIIDYDTNKKDAQKLLRDIDNIEVIPRCVYDDSYEIFKEYEEETVFRRKVEIRREINKLTISINKSNINRLGNFITKCPDIEGLFIIDTKYDKDTGLFLKKDEGYDIDNRMG